LALASDARRPGRAWPVTELAAALKAENRRRFGGGASPRTGDCQCHHLRAAATPRFGSGQSTAGTAQERTGFDDSTIRDRDHAGHNQALWANARARAAACAGAAAGRGAYPPGAAAL
jgi:hypothetical protein